MTTRDTAEYWRGRAEEARTVAEQMSDPIARATMLRIAERYELLARQAAPKRSDGTK